jgi:catechol 2,3-dioxygenase-like lactoylglutathione lyase family enzyme
MRQRISLITLGVRDFERSLKFYRDGLGWQPSSASGDDVAFFQMSGLVFGLYPRHKLAEDANVAAQGGGFSGVTLAYNTKSKQEVEEVLDMARELGAKITKEAQDVFWGGYNGYFEDLDGYLWEVAWNPFFEFDENDNIRLP